MNLCCRDFISCTLNSSEMCSFFKLWQVIKVLRVETLDRIDSHRFWFYQLSVIHFSPLSQTHPLTYLQSAPLFWHALELCVRFLSCCVAAWLDPWLIGSGRSDCVNLKSLFSCRFYLSLLCSCRNIGFRCEKYNSQQASLCHFSMISAWYAEGGLTATWTVEMNSFASPRPPSTFMSSNWSLSL